MPIFRYTTKDAAGEYHKGEVETIDERQAANLLRRKKLIVISLKSKDEATQRIWDRLFARVSFSDVAMITRQLATMIESGLVLSEALDILQEQQENSRLKKVLGSISADVKGGLDFVNSLEKHQDIFPPLYIQLVRAGQASGRLDTILLQLSTNLEKEREFRSRLRGAMVYPVVVVTMMILVMLVMVFFVMPKLMGLYKESGIDLPLPTKILIGGTQALLQFWWALLLLLVVVTLSVRRYLQTPRGRLFFDSFLLKMPVVGRLINFVIITSFTRTFGLLTSSGVSILDSIRISQGLAGNLVYRNAFEIIYRGVERGLSFSSQALSLNVFPRIVGQMAKTGEETGKLDEVMFRLADYFESETDNSLKNVTTLIEPIVLVILGIGVAFLVISIILPIYQLTTNIK